MNSPCQRTNAIFQPGVAFPAIYCCFGTHSTCESCGRPKPDPKKPRPKKGSFEDVFGHLGNPEEVAKMWTDMQEKLEDALRPLKAWEIADALLVSIGENLDTYDLRMFDFAREIEKRHGSTPPEVPAVAG